MKSGKAQLESIISSIGDALIATDAGRRITYLNPVGERLTGWKTTEAVGKPLEEIFKVVSETSHQPAESSLHKALSTGTTTRLSNHTLLLNRNGDEIPVAECSAPIKDENGNTTGAVLIFRDQTEERAKRKALEESEERFRKIGSSALDALIMINEKGGVEYWNPAAEKMFGYVAKEVTGRNLHDLIMPEMYREVFTRAWAKYIKSGEGDAIGNMRQLTARRKDGHEFPIELALSSIHHGGSFWALGFVRDISERREVEQALRKSEESLRTTLDSIGDAVIATDPDGKVTRMNPVAQKLTGWPLAKALGRSLSVVFNICNARTRKRVVNPVSRVIKNGKVVGLANHTLLISKDGAEYQIADSTAPIRDDAGETSGAVLVFRDVSEAYKMREELAAAEQRFRTFFEHQPDYCYVISIDGKILDVNRSALAVLGYEKDDLVGKSALSALYAPACRKKAKALFEKWRKTGRLVDEELSILTAGGEERQVLLSAEAHLDADGKLVSSILVHRDVTERRRSERIQAALYSISESYRVSGDLRELLREIHRQVGTFMDVTNFYVALYEESRTVYSFPYFVDEFDTVESFTELSLKDTLTDFVRRTGEPLFADEQTTRRMIDNGDVTPVGTPSPIWLGVPLKAAGHVLGVMVVQHYSDGSIYSQEDLDALSLISGQVAPVVEHKRTEQQIRRLSQGLEQSPVSIIITNRDAEIEYVNPRFSEVSGYTPAEVLGKNPRVLKSGATTAEIYRHMWKTITSGKFWHGEFANRKKNGELYWEDAHVGPIMDERGHITHYIALKEDITLRKQLEEQKIALEAQLRIAQKMEAVGVMAAGIAHDFNNLLTPILGYSDMLAREVPPNTDLQDDLSSIAQAAARAKELVQQILTFSREASREQLPVRMQHIVKQVVKLVRASMPPSIQVREEIDPACGVIMADGAQMHQVVMNLCTNACHAMRETGGVLGLRLEPFTLDAPENRLPGLPPGAYLRLTVSDTGCGMERKTLERIFDPFFTTKTAGEGTGLGLSVLYGILKSCGGEITVDSEVDKGTTFQVYLPASEGIAAQEAGKPPVASGNGEHVLFVDDREEIVHLVKRMLERLKYVVECHCSSTEALDHFRAHPDDFDVVITDLSMPGLNGLELAREITGIKAGIPIILVSGYSERATAEALESCGVSKVVMKPIVAGEIGAAIREVLDA